MVMRAEIVQSAAQGLLIDAFGAAPELASRIPGLGGPHAPPDPAYVFRTATVRPALGRVVFTIRFDDLHASSGTIVLQIETVSAFPGAPQSILRTTVVPMADLASTGGTHQIEIISRRNMLYAVAGSIYDETDSVASDISVILDQQTAAEPHEPKSGDFLVVTSGAHQGTGEVWATPRLLSLEPPSLYHPVSQGWTPAQCAQPAFDEWMQALRQPAEPTQSNWEAVYVLQALRCYGALRLGASGLGLGVEGQSLPALLAAHGCSVLATARHEDDLPDADPGLALEELLRPHICPPAQFFDLVHFTTIDVAAITPAITGFDFLWSSGVADRAATVQKYLQFVEDSMVCLKPGGVAVHLFRRGRCTGALATGGFALARPDIERIALSLVSRGHEAAQLKFGYRAKTGLEVLAEVPFGLIVKRG